MSLLRPLLSLVLPSWMVASVRDLANIQLSTMTFISGHSIHCPVLNMEEDIDMSTTRGRTLMGSKNNSRDSSIISKTSSIPYHECMEIQNLNTSWFNQVEDELLTSSLNTNVKESNISNIPITGNNSKGKQCKFNEASALNNMLPPHGTSMAINQYVSNLQNIEVPINYNINGPTELNSWNGEAHPISIFGYMEFL